MKGEARVKMENKTEVPNSAGSESNVDGEFETLVAATIAI